RNGAGRRIALAVTRIMEARSSRALPALLEDPRLAPRPGRRLGFARAIAPIVRRTRLPIRVGRALASPEGARERIRRLVAETASLGVLPPDASAADRLDVYERLIFEGFQRLAPGILPTAFAALVSYALASRLLGPLATPA